MLTKERDLCKCKLPIFEQLIKSNIDGNFYTVCIPVISRQTKYAHVYIYITYLVVNRGSLSCRTTTTTLDVDHPVGLTLLH